MKPRERRKQKPRQNREPARGAGKNRKGESKPVSALLARGGAVGERRGESGPQNAKQELGQARANGAKQQTENRCARPSMQQRRTRTLEQIEPREPGREDRAKQKQQIRKQRKEVDKSEEKGRGKRKEKRERPKKKARGKGKKERKKDKKRPAKSRPDRIGSATREPGKAGGGPGRSAELKTEKAGRARGGGVGAPQAQPA